MSKASIFFLKKGETLWKESSSSSPQSVRHCSDILQDSQEREHSRPVGNTAEDALESISYVHLCTCICFCIISTVILTALKDESCICVISWLRTTLAAQALYRNAGVGSCSVTRVLVIFFSCGQDSGGEVRKNRWWQYSPPTHSSKTVPMVGLFSDLGCLF